MANDQQLWEQICRGDAEAFNGFYCEHAPRLQAFLRQLVGNSQTAEDIMQETFTQMWRHPNGFQPERGSLRTYLFGIGRKRAANWWRKQKLEESVDEKEGTSASAENNSIISDALRRLPEEQRSLLWLREVEGQSYAELAVILNVPVGTVRSRLFAAREALRKVWKGEAQSAKESL